MFRERDAATVTTMYRTACDMLEGCCPRAAAVLEEAEPDALAYLGFPPTQWKCMRTNNVQKGTNREIKRRSRFVQMFPSSGSLVRMLSLIIANNKRICYFSKATA